MLAVPLRSASCRHLPISQILPSAAIPRKAPGISAYRMQPARPGTTATERGPMQGTSIISGQLQSECLYSGLYLLDDRDIGLVRLPGRVFEPPILVEWPANEGAPYIASHGYRDIRRRYLRYGLRMLGLFHIDAIKLLHDAYRIRIDMGLRLCSCRAALEDIRGKELAQCLCNLASACVVHADECYLRLSHGTNQLPVQISVSVTREALATQISMIPSSCMPWDSSPERTSAPS